MTINEQILEWLEIVRSDKVREDTRQSALREVNTLLQKRGETRKEKKWKITE